MDYKKIYLEKVSDGKVNSSAFLEIYNPEVINEIQVPHRPAIVILPGGAYQMCSRREAEPVALRFASEGFVCFVLIYTCNVQFPAPHLEVALAFDFIRNHIDEFYVDKNRISILGFSAGGHLAASYALLYKEFANNLDLNEENLKPDAVILGYPVTSMILDTASETKNIITGGNEEFKRKLTVPENLTSYYPPTFIWSTKNDMCVPVEHSLLMKKALDNYGINSELVLFENGCHGGSLVNRAVYSPDFNFKDTLENRNWVDKAVEFIYELK